MASTSIAIESNPPATRHGAAAYNIQTGRAAVLFTIAEEVPIFTHIGDVGTFKVSLDDISFLQVFVR